MPRIIQMYTYICTDLLIVLWKTVRRITTIIIFSIDTTEYTNQIQCSRDEVL